MARANLLSLFNQFPQMGRETAVIQMQGYRRQQLTYAELHADALYWSQALASAGIGVGDRVLLWGPNSAQWVACFWAILLRGAVAVPMDAAATPRNLTLRKVRLVWFTKAHVPLGKCQIAPWGPPKVPANAPNAGTLPRFCSLPAQPVNHEGWC